MNRLSVVPQPSCRPIKHNILPMSRLVSHFVMSALRCRPPKHPSYLRHRAGVPPTDVCVERCRLLKHVSHDCPGRVPTRDVHVERCSPRNIVPCSSPSLCPKQKCPRGCLKPETGACSPQRWRPEFMLHDDLCVVDEAGIDGVFQVISVCVRVCLCPTTRRKQEKPKKHAGGFLPPRARGAARARAIAVPGGKWASRANVARANVRSREGETRASADLARMVVSPHKHRRGILSRGVG